MYANKRKMKKKAEMSITVIIAAAIGLAILLIFFVTFTSEAGDFNRNVRSCESRGGECVVKGSCQNQITSWQCSNNDKPECCFNPLSSR